MTLHIFACFACISRAVVRYYYASSTATARTDYIVSALVASVEQVAGVSVTAAASVCSGQFELYNSPACDPHHGMIQ